MPWVTEEEIQAAKNMTAYEYLRTHQAQRLQKTRTRNEWQLTDHDSFKINELSSKWHWKARDIGGVSAPVSYTHLDVYKRQPYTSQGKCPSEWQTYERTRRTDAVSYTHLDRA